jgi:hypothetical protein
MELTSRQRSRLLACSGGALGILLRDSTIRVLILNGQSVVDHFEALINARLDREEQAEWTLSRQAGAAVRGMSYYGVVDNVGSAYLGRDVLVLGYNHNIQSSFGVTSRAISSLATWIGTAAANWAS